MTTDYVVRYQDAKAVISSHSLAEAEEFAALLRGQGVQNVRLFRRLTETREEECGKEFEASLPTAEEVRAIYVPDTHTATSGCKEWVEHRIEQFLGNAPTPFCPWCGEAVR